jgi:hypothetical protein
MQNTVTWERPCSREMRSNLRCCPGDNCGAGERVSGTGSGCDVVGVVLGSDGVGVADPPQAFADSKAATSKVTVRASRRLGVFLCSTSITCPLHETCACGLPAVHRFGLCFKRGRETSASRVGGDIKFCFQEGDGHFALPSSVSWPTSPVNQAPLLSLSYHTLSVHTKTVKGGTCVTTKAGNEALLVHTRRIRLQYVTNLQQSIGRQRECYTFT